MAEVALHRLDNRNQLLRPAERVQHWLRNSGMTAKQVAREAGIDVRTAQNAFNGHCSLDTFDALAGAFGWQFPEDILTPKIGADPLAAREAQLARHQAEVAAIHARLQRERAARAGVAALSPSLSVVGRGPSVQALQRYGQRGSEGEEAPAGA